MSTPRLVIFDCDGVLVDSETISNGVLAEALAAHGLSMTMAEARREFQGLLLSEVVQRAQERLGHELPEGWLARFESDRAHAFRQRLQPVAGAAEAVRCVSRAGIAVCVASQGKLAPCGHFRLTRQDSSARRVRARARARDLRLRRSTGR